MPDMVFVSVMVTIMRRSGLGDAVSCLSGRIGERWWDWIGVKEALRAQKGPRVVLVTDNAALVD